MNCPKLEIRRGSVEQTNGVWESAETQGRLSALVSCLQCGRTISLSKHAIADDGMVSPSLICPYDDCGFHAWLRLVGWLRTKPGAQKVLGQPWARDRSMAAHRRLGRAFCGRG
jgi:hypothetical protein